MNPKMLKYCLTSLLNQFFWSLTAYALAVSVREARSMLDPQDQ